MSDQPLPPGSVIGIMGGGQLGRMLSHAAARLGYSVHIYCPDSDAPASDVSAKTTIASYNDQQSLAAFADNVHVVTFEFENVPHESLKLLESKVQVAPGASVLQLSQNRLREKQFANMQGIATAPFKAIMEADHIAPALKALGGQGIIKTTELGYDGKGQRKISDKDDAADVWKSLRTKEAILEGIVDFTMEISVIVARNAKGEMAVYDPVQNIHSNHILDRTIAPAPVSEALVKEAQRIAMHLAETMGVVGLLAVEMFVTKDGKILMNEVAPRPHNSGHWTMDACMTSQFEQHIRAICGLKLGSTQRLFDAEMKNLIGKDVHDWPRYLSMPNARLHLYGKAEVREGRKMGHVNILKLK